MRTRTLTSIAVVVTAGLLLFGGVALAREQQPGDDHRDQVIDTQTPSPDTASASRRPGLDQFCPGRCTVDLRP